MSDNEQPGQPVAAMARVERERGRWVVWLNIQTWTEHADSGTHPIENHWRQINDYATERQAQVAADWVERSANRDLRPPTGF